jgi:hypothetical protein
LVYGAQKNKGQKESSKPFLCPFEKSSRQTDHSPPPTIWLLLTYEKKKMSSDFWRFLRSLEISDYTDYYMITQIRDEI